MSLDAPSAALAPSRAAVSGVRPGPAMPRYRLVALGALGAGGGRPTAINRAGWVAGFAAIRGGVNHAFLSRDERMRDLGALPGLPTSMAAGINDAGTVVGLSRGPRLSDASDAWVWRQGHFKDLGRTLDSRRSGATAINSSGWVVGWFVTRSGKQQGFLWAAGKMRKLPLEIAIGVNNRGEVVGMHGEDGALVRGGGATAIGLDEKKSFVPSAVNDAGEMAGQLWGKSGAYLYSAGHVSRLERGGFVASAAHGINNKGDVVGYAILKKPTNGLVVEGHGVLWRGDRIIDLNDAVVGRRRWVVEDAVAINDRGQIACSGYLVGRQVSEALLLTPIQRAR